MFFFIDSDYSSIFYRNFVYKIMFKEADRFSKKKGVKKFSSCYRDSFDGILEVGILSFGFMNKFEKIEKSGILMELLLFNV